MFYINKKKLSPEKMTKILTSTEFNVVETSNQDKWKSHWAITPIPVEDWNALNALDIELNHKLSQYW